VSDRIPTLADLCCAIAEGHIAAAVEGSMYQVNAFELRRYFNKQRPLPTVSSSRAQSHSPRPEFLDWSEEIQQNATTWPLGPFFYASEQGGCASGK